MQLRIVIFGVFDGEERRMPFFVLSLPHVQICWRHTRAVQGRGEWAQILEHFSQACVVNALIWGNQYMNCYHFHF